MNGKTGDKHAQIRSIGFILFFLLIFHQSFLLDGKRYKKSVSKTIEGIHFKICVNKAKIKKDEFLEIKLKVKIPKNRNIYVAGNNFWKCGHSYSLDTLFFCLGDSNIYGDRIPQLFDLKEISRRGSYRNRLSFKLSEIEKKFDIYLYGEVELKFKVSFCKELCEPLKDIILKEEWSHWAYSSDEWYLECYGNFFRDFVSDETIGIIKIRIKE